ncbi:hypothetical protein FRZ67_22975 [Panacibacter ginsenosidivorans]|uniref:Peptidyl-prolyl cis-trans isomerase n=1 Tax=Panacibacter ginsenosidivorans TaxID=1813871 RepID=A0A5B8VFV8_9BACT|nr:FKBP-type peptidyl-prolyl cis-trans isomerase [Panacibacter ginsenosidivorans]QEC70023.1 hypothetical protein FRZ67_22975 [Panacibacter ginsenosidivorans]
MKKLPVIVLLMILFYSCGKSNTNSMCTNVAPSSEASTMAAFCVSNSITYQTDDNGIFYQIIEPGTGAPPDLNDTVYVLYTGTYLNGTVLDEQQTTPYASILNGFIDGWKLGLQKIAKGGEIKMVIPSSLCYACTGIPGAVPPNTILYFDVKLTDIKPAP